MILSGKEGLKSVAEREGRWNWVLVGPNPETLPLVGGGIGSIEEMQQCLAKQEREAEAEKQFANFYGLLRLRFGTGRMGRTKYVFVQASRVDDLEDGAAGGAGSLKHSGSALSAVKHGQAMSQRGAMEKALLEFVHFTAKIEATRLEDLAIESAIEKLQKVSTADADFITLAAYHVAREEFIKAHPEAQVAAPEAASNDKAMLKACAAEIFDQECAPTSEVHDVVQEAVDDKEEIKAFPMAATKSDASGLDDSDDEAPKKRIIPLPMSPGEEPTPEPTPAADGTTRKKGDQLFVYSNVSKQWLDDGVIVEVLEATGLHDGLSLPVGSVKVIYNNRNQFKWVTPAQFDHHMKPSSRPTPPPTLLGQLLKETHNWISQWHVRYFELSKGYLQWWMSAEDAKNRVAPNGSLSLNGLEMTVKETVMYARSSGSKGTIYAFDATTLESVAKWSGLMKRHEDYCRKMQAYMTERAHQMEKVDGDEKFSGMVVERKRRASLTTDAAAAISSAIPK